MSHPSKFAACIFDLDGVLVDTAKYHYHAWKRLANSLGVDFSEQQNEKLKGVSRVNSLKQILKWGHIEMSEDKQAALRDTKNNWYLEHLETLTDKEILPHAKEFLDHVAESGVKIALGSASKNAVKVLKMTGLLPYFEVISDGNNTVNTKPDPEVFLNASTALGVSPEHSIVFEDSEKGIEAANKGGFISVGIGHPETLQHAMVVIPSFENIRLHSFDKLLVKT